MNEVCLKNAQYTGAENKIGLYDLSIIDSSSDSIVVFMHGYMGFKDWGCWNLVQDFFTKNGFNFAKLNVTHNGTTLNSPSDFEDLDAFSNNSYWREYCDLKSFIVHLETTYSFKNIHLIGHSRGGGIVLLNAHHPSVKSITTWAGISSIEKRIPSGEKLEEWLKNGYYFIQNGRTNQQMPHAISQYQEFMLHKDELSIETACKSTNKLICVIHGTSDTSVNISESEEICSWKSSHLHRIENANHTFEAMHPWNEKSLPSSLLKVCQITIEYYNTLNK